MGIGVGLFLIAVGAILTWAVSNPSDGSVNVHVVGVILMCVGLAGMLLSLLFWESWAGRGMWHRRAYAEGPRAYDDEVVVERPARRAVRRTVVEERDPDVY